MFVSIICLMCFNVLLCLAGHVRQQRHHRHLLILTIILRIIMIIITCAYSIPRHTHLCVAKLRLIPIAALQVI